MVAWRVEPGSEQSAIGDLLGEDFSLAEFTNSMGMLASARRDVGTRPATGLTTTVPDA